MKKPLILMLSILLVSLGCVTATPAQADKEPPTVKEAQAAAKVKREVSKLGFNEQLDVKLRDGTKVRGRITGIADDVFLVTDSKGVETKIWYSGVKKVIKGDFSKGGQLKLFALAAGALGGMLALILIVGPKDSVTR